MEIGPLISVYCTIQVQFVTFTSSTKRSVPAAHTSN